MKRKSLYLVCALLVLSACSTKFVYNNLDWLLYSYLNDYVELDRKQKGAFDLTVTQLHDWHRAKELSLYRQQLMDLQEAVQTGPISENQWLAIFAQGMDHWTRSRDRIAPELLPIAQDLTDQQIKNLFEKLRKEDDKRIRKYNKKTEQEHLADNIEKSRDLMEDWLGRLTKEQVAVMADYLPQFESNFDPWMLYRKEIQQAARELFDTRKYNVNFEKDLLALLLNPEAYQSAEYIRISDHNLHLSAQMLAQISALMTEKQKGKLSKELQDLIDDLADLIEDD